MCVFLTELFLLVNGCVTMSICLELSQVLLVVRRWAVGPIQNTTVDSAVVKLSSLFIICKIKLLLKCFLFDLKVQLREEHVVSISLGQHKKEIACIISHFFSRTKFNIWENYFNK